MFNLSLLEGKYDYIMSLFEALDKCFFFFCTLFNIKTISPPPHRNVKNSLIREKLLIGPVQPRPPSPIKRLNRLEEAK